MKKNIINTHASKESAILGPGSTLESVGVFFMLKIPTPLPTDICDRCIEELAQQIGKLEIDYLTKNVKTEIYQYRKLKLDLQVKYYNQCKKLTLKGQTQ
jgi:hypothetical protein